MKKEKYVKKQQKLVLELFYIQYKRFLDPLDADLSDREEILEMAIKALDDYIKMVF